MIVRATLVVCLVTSGSALAGSCFEEVTDALKCGGTEVAICTKELTDEAECGTKKITNAAKCGTETVTDGTKCGWDTFTSVAICGAECVGSLGAKCSCKKAKSCKVPKSCRVAKTCDVEFDCERPKTCFVRVPNCEPFPGAWKAKLLAAFGANHEAEVRKRLTAMKAPDPAALGNRLEQLPDTMKPYLVYVGKKADKWGSVLKSDKAIELLQRIVMKAAKKDLDKELKKDVAELTRLLRVRGWDPAEDAKSVKLPGFPGLPPMRMVVDADDEDGEEEVKKSAAAPKAAGKKQKKSEPKMYEHTYAVTVNIGLGAGAGGIASIGVTWDDDGDVKGIVSLGYSVGLQGKAEFDFTFSVAPGTLKDVPGMSIGVTGGAAYYVGGVAFVEWAIPAQFAIPTWGYGPAVGVGAGLSYTSVDTWTFGG